MATSTRAPARAANATSVARRTPRTATFAHPGGAAARQAPEPLQRQLVVRFKPEVLRRGLQRSGETGAPTLVAGAGHDPLLERLRQDHGLKHVEPLFGTSSPARSAASLARLRSALAAATVPDLQAPDDRNVGFATLEFGDASQAGKALQLLRADGTIEIAEPVPVRWLAGRLPDPALNRQWGLRAIGFFGAKRPEAAGVPVAVLDSGIDVKHPQLAGVVTAYKHFGWVPDDLEEHGTHVAGTIAALVEDAAGISGLADCPLLAWKIIEDKPTKQGLRYVAFKEYARALAEVETSGAKVLNLSIGGPASSEVERLLFRRLADADVFVAAAMGNEYEEGNEKSYPAAYKGVYAIGAVDEVGRRAAFSNTGAHAYLSAPGTNVLSTVPLRGNPLGLDCYDGTSMATPHVAGAAALVRARFPKLTAVEVAERLARAAEPGVRQKAGTRSQSYGWGILRLDRALR
ncbi:MAG: S8 family peptidase [Ramlibacter sp.]